MIRLIISAWDWRYAIGFRQQLSTTSRLNHLSWRLWWVILCTLEQRMEVSHEISRADRCLFGLSYWLSTRSSTATCLTAWHGMNIFLISALRQLGVTLNFVRRNTYCCSQEAKNLAFFVPTWSMPLQRGIRIQPKISSNSNEFNVVLPVLLKKDYHHTTSATGLLDEFGWL